MAGFRPAQARAENLRKLSEEQKAALLGMIRLDVPSPMRRAILQQLSKFTPITTSPFQLKRIPTETAGFKVIDGHILSAPLPERRVPRNAAASFLAVMNGITDSFPGEIGNRFLAGTDTLYGKLSGDDYTSYRRASGAARPGSF